MAREVYTVFYRTRTGVYSSERIVAVSPENAKREWEAHRKQHVFITATLAQA
jgi:hypothetical protein